MALQRIWLEVLDAANRYIEATAPFKLAKTDRDACKAVLVNLAEAIRVAAILIKPFLPRTAETFYRRSTSGTSSPGSASATPTPPPCPLQRDSRVAGEFVGGKPGALVPEDRVQGR